MFIVQYVVEGNVNAEIPFQSEAAAELAALRLAEEGRRHVVIFEQGEIPIEGRCGDNDCTEEHP